MLPAPAKERALARDVTINIRAQQRQKELIDQAAVAIGKNRSDFMLEAACEKAEDVLLDRRIFVLSDEQYQAFLNALDAPVQPNDKLKNLLQTPAPWDA
jgi:uncharacterized protein (DUF1778 family)